MEIYESGEMYLETILILQNKNGSVRSIDVANELNYTKASISRAMSKLKQSGYIEIGESGNIILTKTGSKKANEIFSRHEVITAFLIKTLSIDEKTAAKDACRIEHIISKEVFEKMRDFIDNL